MSSEKRQLTVLFCDLVGSTRLSEKLDPEDYRDLLRAYQETSAEAIEQYDGYIAQHLGDGLLVYFGYPISFEDNTHRAINAGLKIIEAIENVGIKLGNDEIIEIEVKIGIDTGSVLVDEIVNLNKSEHIALGKPPNVASRLKDIASPNQLVISSNVFRLVSDKFEVKNLGPQSLKGISKPIDAYKVIKQKLFDEKNYFTPLVGRNSEKDLILDRWERVNENEGQVVMIIGEAGIGKSRLIHDIKDEILINDVAKIECFCSPYYQNSFLYPVWDFFRRFLSKKENINSENINEKLKKIGISDEVIGIFSNFINLERKEKQEIILNQSPKLIKQKVFDEFVNLILSESENKPVLCIFEDLHWSDYSTQEFLNYLINNIPKSKILLLITYRREFKPIWETKSYITHIVLNRLTRKQAELIVENIAGNRLLPEIDINEIVKKSDGNPLYLEEMTKMLLSDQKTTKDKNNGSVPTPDSLNDLLMAKLDSLKKEKQLVKLASVLGNEFSYELISAISSISKNKLTKLLNNLVENEVLHQKGIMPSSKFFFKHHLMQEAAYNSLLKAEKKVINKEIASILEKKSKTSEIQPEVLAHHFTEAGLNKQAIKYLIVSGKNAIKTSAHREGINHFKMALKLLDNSKISGTDKDKTEAEILILLGGGLRVVKGFASDEIEQIYEKALNLTQKTGDELQSFKALRGLSGYYLAKAKFKKAKELSRKNLEIGKNLQTKYNLIQSHYLLSAILLCEGNFKESLNHSEISLSNYEPKLHSSSPEIYGMDPSVACMFWNSWALWFLGQPENALKKGYESLNHSESISHSYSCAISLVHLSFLHTWIREPENVIKYATRAIEISKENGFEFFLEMAEILKGYALVELGEKAKGILMINDGIFKMTDIGAELFFSYWYTLLSIAHFKNGELDDAMLNIENAEKTANKNNEKFYLPEIYRIKAEIHMDLGKCDKSEITNLYSKAIDISEKQGSKILNIRSLISFYNFIDAKKNKQKIKEKLKDVYNSFNQGHDLSDLKEAKQLIG